MRPPTKRMLFGLGVWGVDGVVNSKAVRRGAWDLLVGFNCLEFSDSNGYMHIGEGFLGSSLSPCWFFYVYIHEN